MAEPEPSIDAVPSGGYLHVNCSPSRQPGDSVAHIDGVYAAAQEHGYSQALVDYTATTRQLQIVELYQLGNYLVGRNLRHRLKIALVTHTAPDCAAGFFENVARNRAVNLRIFQQDVESATAWLLDDKS